MTARGLGLVAVLLCLCILPASSMTLARDGMPGAAIVLPQDAGIAEQTAAAELCDYLTKVAGATFHVTDEETATGPSMYVGRTQFAEKVGIDVAKLDEEAWVIRTVGDDLVLAGGGARGTLYAVYRFLEDIVGVHWWTPWEESVPDIATLKVDELDLSGKPMIRYRDIYMLYGNDGGRCAARNRLNRQGDARIAKEYGGCMDYGPPYHVHTFYMYFRPDKYLDQHPEWFSLIDGQRVGGRHQLCLTNPELRKAFLAKFRGFIESSRRDAKAQGVPPPVVFSISQNDWGGACQCDDCQAIAKAEESEAGPLLDFVNYLADAVRDDYPDVYISTLAYQYTQKPPKSVKPRDNVIIRLCDTRSNFTKPITAPENTEFREFLLSWAAIAKNLRVWDYAVTYAPPRGLPFPSVHTYQADYQFYSEHNVEGVFTEHEYPIIGDLHDLKAWMMMKLLEDPYQDYEALLQAFTDGFYGPAGPEIREYLGMLQAACDARGSHVGMGTGVSGFSYLNLGFIREAQGLFDRAERKLVSEAAGDSEFFVRLRHARLPIDRAAMIRFKEMAREWISLGNSAETMPLDRDEIVSRVRETWHTAIDRHIAGPRQEAEGTKADEEITKYAGLPVFVPLPAKFRDLPPGTVFDFTADTSRNWRNIVELVKDDEAESGFTNRLQFPPARGAADHSLEKYKLPMPWGLYQPTTREFNYSETIKPESVPGPGYNWYKMSKPQRIGPSQYLYFFWSWIIQVDIDSAMDPRNPGQEFDVWARIKFEGPAFPHGKADDKNAICVERVVLVKTGVGQ